MLALWLVGSALAFDVMTNDGGVPAHYDGWPVRFRYEAEGTPKTIGPATAENAADDAFVPWEDVDGADVEFEAADDDPDANPVHWVTDWTYDPDILALTSTWTDGDGAITGFEIRINGAYDNWGTNEDPDRMDLENALTHEVGHALGLQHNPDDDQATMFPSAWDGDLGKRTLDTDDEDAIRYLYGTGTFDGGGSPAGCDATGAAGLAGLTSWAPLAAALLFLRRRKTRSEVSR